VVGCARSIGGSDELLARTYANLGNVLNFFATLLRAYVAAGGISVVLALLLISIGFGRIRVEQPEAAKDGVEVFGLVLLVAIPWFAAYAAVVDLRGLPTNKLLVVAISAILVGLATAAGWFGNESDAEVVGLASSSLVFGSALIVWAAIALLRQGRSRA
jgi:hypothetical protein